MNLKSRTRRRSISERAGLVVVAVAVVVGHQQGSPVEWSKSQSELLLLLLLLSCLRH